MIKKPEVQAELLNEVYYNAFRPDNGQPIATLSQSLMMETAVFTPCHDHKELSILEISKNLGPDQLHP